MHVSTFMSCCICRCSFGSSIDTASRSSTCHGEREFSSKSKIRIKRSNQSQSVSSLGIPSSAGSQS